jgi:hypothetical protein
MVVQSRKSPISTPRYGVDASHMIAVYLPVAHTHQKMPTRDQVSGLGRSPECTAQLDASTIEGCYITSVATRMLVENIILDHLKLTDEQITCLYDMDIVFQPSGNFDEVYLYVRAHL